MSITCRSILNLPYANQSRLLAGESGLGNEIRWVHYLEEPRYVEWLKGGELIIMAGIITGSDSTELSKLIQSLFDKQVAGIIISISEFIPEVPKELFPLCDWLGLPLFEVPAHVRIIDINQSICRAILQQKKRTDEIGSILQDLLYGKRLSDRRLQRLKSIGFAEDQIFRAVRFQVESYTSPVRAKTAPDLHGVAFYEEEMEAQCLYDLADLIREVLEKQRNACYLTTDIDGVLWLADVKAGERITPVLTAILELLDQRLPGTQVRIGVSAEFSDIRTLGRHAEHARDSLRLIGNQKTAASIVFFDDMVAYQLFQAVGSQERLRKMAARILRDLLLPENEDLMQTLLCYIKYDRNAKRTAEELFLHPNTMHYRLNKIQAILNRDLSRSDDLFDVMLALKLYDFAWKSI